MRHRTEGVVGTHLPQKVSGALGAEDLAPCFEVTLDGGEFHSVDRDSLCGWSAQTEAEGLMPGEACGGGRQGAHPQGEPSQPWSWGQRAHFGGEKEQTDHLVGKGMQGE